MIGKVGEWMHRGRKKWFFVTGCCLTAFFVTANVHAESFNSKSRSYYEHVADVMFDVKTDQKVIALTFDDGPNPTFTPQILDVLKQNHAKATFFLVGSRVVEQPQLVKRESAEGHELENHTFSHPTMEKITEKQLLAELKSTQKAIHTFSGQTPHFFRPPEGKFNEGFLHVANQEGYTVVIWSQNLDTKDWSRPGVDKIVNCVLNNARNGTIVLMHDQGIDRSQTVAALKKILPELHKRGYRFVTLSELAQIRLQQATPVAPFNPLNGHGSPASSQK